MIGQIQKREAMGGREGAFPIHVTDAMLRVFCRFSTPVLGSMTDDISASSR
jgi:hypothetical protein